jgi:hypothetical protein
MAEPVEPFVTASVTRTITVAGDNLFAVAARELMDATQWDRIARLNKIVDPWLEGIVTLKLPRVDSQTGTGGVLRP